MPVRVLKVAGVTGAASLAMLLVAGATLCLTSGCSSIGYLAQSAHGHLQLVAGARPVDHWLADPQTPEVLKQRLALSQRIRDFAVTELHLPDNRSYRSYADLQRPAAVWNVVAAPELSLKLQTWCFPVVGCIGYRGYYDQAGAEQAAEALRAPGLEVAVYPVPAYSTLGKTDFLGGDPLLNTFIQWPEGELARLIFHELSHQVAYAPGDTTFNESYATAVERLGGERWLAALGSDSARAQFAALDARRRDVRALIERTRGELDELFAGPLSEPAKRQRKEELMAAMRAEHERLKRERWGGFTGYDTFFRQLNNALLGVQGAYHGRVPAFEALFEREGRDFARFHLAVARLAGLPRQARDAALDELASHANPAVQ
jgi:predicted aminopeptidase